MKKHNFSAGPCILPQEVLLKASEAVQDFNGMGLSLIEISHRSKEFISVLRKSKSPCFRALDLENKGYQPYTSLVGPVWSLFVWLTIFLKIREDI